MSILYRRFWRAIAEGASTIWNVKTIELIRSDAARYGTNPNWVRLYFTVRGFRLSVWLRLAKSVRAWPSWSWPIKVFVMLGLRRAQNSIGTDIGADAEFGPGLYLRHAIGIVVHSKAKIGANCNLSQNVTIGKKHGGSRAGVPTIGDNVFIAPGAVVIGGIRVGDGATVGPNSVVIRDVAPGVTVSGGAAVPLESATNRSGPSGNA